MKYTINEILALDDIPEKIRLLKKGRKTENPDRMALWKDWNPKLHEIMTDKEKYPDRKILKEEAKTVYDEKSGRSVTEEAKYDTEEVNRIVVPLEQDIINTQTAFTVGIEPSLECVPSDNGESKLFEAVKMTLKANKTKYRNKKIVRSWLAEQEVAEYWYAVQDESFWAKLWSKAKEAFGGRTRPSQRLKSVIWSPFRGDILYPFFNDEGDMVAFSREYKKTLLDGTEITSFMTITDSMVYRWETASEGYVEKQPFSHGFKKIPVLYAYRSEPFCAKIKTFRVRIEKLLSNYADCIDYHFFPLLKLIGDVDGFMGKVKDKIVKLTGEGADAQYLTWNQVPTTVEFELNTLFDKAYSMTNTPQISFDKLKGTGNALSGVAFDYVFMSTHMEVSNHAEELGEFFQRRINFLVSACASINPTELDKASLTIDIETDIVPYRLDNIEDKVNIADKAVNGGIWSRRKGVIFAGNADRVEEELDEIGNDPIKESGKNKE